MPDGNSTKAPLIIFGTLLTMSFLTIAIVFVTHWEREVPYMDSKMIPVGYQDDLDDDFGPEAAPLETGKLDARQLDARQLDAEKEDTKHLDANTER